MIQRERARERERGSERGRGRERGREREGEAPAEGVGVRCGDGCDARLVPSVHWDPKGGHEHADAGSRPLPIAGVGRGWRGT